MTKGDGLVGRRLLSTQGLISTDIARDNRYWVDRDVDRDKDCLQVAGSPHTPRKVAVLATVER